MKDYQNLTNRDGTRLQAWLKSATTAFQKVEMGKLDRDLARMNRICHRVARGESTVFSPRGAYYIQTQVELAARLGQKDELYHLFSRLGDSASRAAKTPSSAPLGVDHAGTSFPHRMGGAAHGMSAS